MTATSRPDFLRRLALAGLCLLGLSTHAHTQARDSAEYTLRVAAKKTISSSQRNGTAPFTSIPASPNNHEKELFASVEFVAADLVAGG